MNKLNMATKIAWKYLGTPYIWGGDDPIFGFDCSGFVIEILKSVGILPRTGDWTAQGLYGMFSPDYVIATVEKIKEGMIVFWHSSSNKTRIIHVEYCLNEELSIGASGGGSDNVTVQDAIDNNSYIKIRPFRSRENIYGYVDPFIEER